MFRNICFGRGSMLALVAAVIFIYGGQAAAETAKLTSAPNVPQALKRSNPTTVVVNFSAKEFTGTLADGVQYGFWSFGGTVPGAYALVDHSIFRVAKGAIGHLVVEGPQNPSIFKAGK